VVDVTHATLVWLRDDLRIADNPALHAAVERGGPVVVTYILDDESPEVRPLGGAGRWWVHHSLDRLRTSLRELGGDLVLRRGPAETVIPALVREADADAVYWNRRYSGARAVDARLKAFLHEEGVEAKSFHANLLFEPGTVLTGAGNPFQVFTPFWKACRAIGVQRGPLHAPERIDGRELPSDELESWGMLPRHPDWAGGLRENCDPGEDAAHERLERFVEDVLEDYHRRDEPGIEATSGLSPYLRYGEISPFQVWDRLHERIPVGGRRNVDKFLSELGWREFNWNILFHNPDLALTNIRREFDSFEWERARPDELQRWQQGRTGIPLVDAGMRELWHSGTVHNRVRMVCASFLIKNLLIDWRIGEQWFWDCLVDADEASNPANWQWVAGSGADAAPYFRVFNPELQREKFDPDGRYVKRWVPEFGTDAYPEPMVDLAESRREALAHYEVVRAAARSTP
jgi:deoxyribodipyrimidine photo-lyase